MKSERVIAYVDGFNLYFGLKSNNWKCYYWLNVYNLCQHLTKPPQHLIQVKYFTSRITKSTPEKRKRQSTYIEALGTLENVKLYYGKYEWSPITCRKCGYQDEMPEEKMTDVQIGVEMVADAYQNKYDTAFLIGGDLDQVPSIEVVRRSFPQKRVVAIFPPNRQRDELRGTANAYLHITESLLKRSILPLEITKQGGYILKCPEEWIKTVSL